MMSDDGPNRRQRRRDRVRGMPHQIFTLVAEDEPQAIRYIGRSTNPQQAYNNLRRLGNLEKWFESVEKRGSYVVMETVEIVTDEQEARERVKVRQVDAMRAGHDLLNQ